MENPEGNDGIGQLRMILAKFALAADPFCQFPRNDVVERVLRFLEQAEQDLIRSGGAVHRPLSFDPGQIFHELGEPLMAAALAELRDFCCVILLIGKTGVGKSATVNSICEEAVHRTDASRPSTNKVQDVERTMEGIKVRLIDTPGLSSSFSASDQHHNERVLRSVKRFIDKNPPDVVLYLDRLDAMPASDQVLYQDPDIPLFRTITRFLGASIWSEAIVVLTHAASPPPDEYPLDLRQILHERSRAIRHAIRRASGNEELTNQVCTVENNAACERAWAAPRILPDVEVSAHDLLLLTLANKSLDEAKMVVRKSKGIPLGEPSEPPEWIHTLPARYLPPILRPWPQLSSPGGVEDTVDADPDDELLAKFSRAPTLTSSGLLPLTLASVPEIPMPDRVLPASFDSGNPSHRYRFPNSSRRWLVRPGINSRGWDHDIAGYEGLRFDRRLLVVENQIPVFISGMLLKDKGVCDFFTTVHSEGGAAAFGLGVERGDKTTCTFGGDTRFHNLGRNNAAAVGGGVTFEGGSLLAGLKIEDRLEIGRDFGLLMSGGGAITLRGDAAYGGRVEATLRGRFYPGVRALSTLVLSAVGGHGNLLLDCNAQCRFNSTGGTSLATELALADLNKVQIVKAGFRLRSSEELRIALLALVPLVGNALWLISVKVLDLFR